MISSIFAFKFFWIMFPIILIFWTILIYDWKKCEKKARNQTYFFALLCTVYMFLGILSCIFTVPAKLELAEEYQNYRSREIIPVETTYKDAQIPDGYYYLEAELIDCQEYISEGEIYYIYSFVAVNYFGAVDYEYDAIYQWESMDVLNFNIPYMLVMDSMTTEDITDDQITIIWGLMS